MKYIAAVLLLLVFFGIANSTNPDHKITYDAVNCYRFWTFPDLRIKNVTYEECYEWFSTRKIKEFSSTTFRKVNNSYLGVSYFWPVSYKGFSEYPIGDINFKIGFYYTKITYDLVFNKVEHLHYTSVLPKLMLKKVWERTKLNCEIERGTCSTKDSVFIIPKFYNSSCPNYVPVLEQKNKEPDIFTSHSKKRFTFCTLLTSVDPPSYEAPSATRCLSWLENKTDKELGKLIEGKHFRMSSFKQLHNELNRSVAVVGSTFLEYDFINKFVYFEHLSKNIKMCSFENGYCLFEQFLLFTDENKLKHYKAEIDA